MSRKVLEGLWKGEKAKILGSLPKTKKSLNTLLIQPVIELNNGEESMVEMGELEFLKQLVPTSLFDQLKLPFIFQKRKSQYILLGEKLEQWVIETILGMTTSSPFLLETYKGRSSYFIYHYKRIQTKIPTLVFLTFTVTT
ncbi:MAG: DUF61 family protein [Promethearchaeota archaeon]